MDAAFEALDAADVRWCLLRDMGDPRAPGNDVDLLVDPGDRRRAEAALARAGFVPASRPGLGTHRFHHARADGATTWVTLDVVTDLAFGPTRSWRPLAARAVLERAVRADGVPRLAPDDTLWLLLAHGLLDRGGLSPDRLAEARRGAVRASLVHPVAEALDRARADGATAIELRDATIRGNRGRLDTVGRVAWPSLRSALPARHRAMTAVRAATQRVRRRLARTPFVAPTGLSVALLAPDGAGKSTLAAALGDCWPLPSRTHYLGLYPVDDPWLQRGPTMLRPFRRYARMWTTVVRAGLDRARGCLVVLDRHPCEVLLDRDARPKARARRLLFGRLVPAADIVLVLDAPAEVLAARKPEHTVAELAARRERYLDLARRTAGVEVVDTAGNLDEAIGRVVDVVWSAWCARGDR